MSSKELYQYMPLAAGEIRLVHILPGKHPEPLTIELVPAPLASVFDKYEALSYMWGPRKPRAKVRHRDIKNTKTCSRLWKTPVVKELKAGRLIHISPNLSAALLALREMSETETRITWIDQLCINQSDQVERAQQVGIMGSIFSNARQVVCWFAEDIWTSPTMARHLRIYSDEIASIPRGVVSGEMLVAKSETIPSEVWSSISRLIMQPYFQRAWIIQELTLAKQVFAAVGKQLFDTNVWLYASVNMYRLPARLMIVSAALRQRIELISHIGILRQRHQKSGILYEYRQRKPKIKLLQLVLRSWQSKCSDPRDKIYSQVGLLDKLEHCVPLNLDIDYSISYEELVRSVLHRAFTEGTDLSLLLYFHPNEDEQNCLWTLDPRRDMVVGPTFHDSCWLFDAASLVQSYILPVGDSLSAFSFRLTHVGTVAKLHSDTSMGGVIGRQALDITYVIGEFECFCNFVDQKMRLSQEDLVGLWYCDMVTRGGYEERWHRLDEGLRTGIVDFWFGKGPYPERESIYLAAMEQRACLVDPSTTLEAEFHKPMIGWIPPGGRVGDELFLVHGFNLPMLARKLPSGNYRFQGPSYVHGIMDGEIFKGRSPKFEDIVFS